MTIEKRSAPAVERRSRAPMTTLSEDLISLLLKSARQCAAVKTLFGAISVPPQKCEPPYCKETIELKYWL